MESKTDLSTLMAAYSATGSVQGRLEEYLMSLRTMAQTFARLDTQRGMLLDQSRIYALSRAIADTVKPGDVVVEIGTGSGILAMLIAQAGASKVYAIEVTELADLAREVVARNGYEQQIEVIHGLSTELELPQRGDVLVTETLGHIGIDEGIVETVMDARSRLLKPEARILPQSIDIVLVPSTDTAVHEREAAFWANPINGLDFSPLAAAAKSRIYIRRASEHLFCSEPKVAIHVDLGNDSCAPREFGAEFVITRPGMVTSLAAWFESQLSPQVRLNSHATLSWYPLLLPVDPPLKLSAGEHVCIDIRARPEGDEEAWTWILKSGNEQRHCGRVQGE